MSLPTIDPKITLRTIINTNIDVKDTQGSPVTVPITITTAWLELAEITAPTIIIEKNTGSIRTRSIGQAFYIGDHLYLITCYAVDLKDGTNIIEAEPLLYKMNKEIERIFLDPSLVLTPSEDTTVNFIKYEGSDEDTLAGISPRLFACGHIVRVIYSNTT